MIVKRNHMISLQTESEIGHGMVNMNENNAGTKFHVHPLFPLTVLIDVTLRSRERSYSYSSSSFRQYKLAPRLPSKPRLDCHISRSHTNTNSNSPYRPTIISLQQAS